jgi:hypothetical protein
MTVAAFQSLCEELCSYLHVPPVKPSSDPEAPAAFHLMRQGVRVDVLHFALTSPEHAFVMFDFGSIPYEEPKAARILLALLDINFMLMQPLPPVLGRNPDTDTIVLRYAIPLADATPAALLAQIDQGIELALEWRQDHFLRPDAPQVQTHGHEAGVPSGSYA